MDDLEATRRIRLLANPLGGIPLVTLTAQARRQDREKCLRTGMDDDLSKPIDREELKTIPIRQLLCKSGTS